MIPAPTVLELIDTFAIRVSVPGCTYVVNWILCSVSSDRGPGCKNADMSIVPVTLQVLFTCVARSVTLNPADLLLSPELRLLMFVVPVGIAYCCLLCG